MSGLLDSFMNGANPATGGFTTDPLANIAMGLLANSGPSYHPVNPWAGAAQGLFRAEAAQKDWQQYQQEKQVRDAQLADIAAKQKFAQQLQARATAPYVSAAGPLPTDRAGMSQLLTASGIPEWQMKGLEMGMPQPVQYKAVGDSLVGINPNTNEVSPVFTGDGKPSDMLRAWQDEQKAGSKESFADFQIRMKQAGRPITDVRVSLPDKGLQAFQAPVAAEFKAQMEKAQGAQDTIASIHQMRNQAAAGMFAGKGASIKSAVTDFLANGLGLPLSPDVKKKLEGATTFGSAAGAQLLAHAKALGSNPSNADAARINQIVGTIDTDPQAMQKIMDWTEGQARKAIALHNERVQQIRQYATSNRMPDPFAFDPSIAMPGEWQAPETVPTTPSPAPQQYKIGQTATNPQTKQKVVWNGMTWAPAQ